MSERTPHRSTCPRCFEPSAFGGVCFRCRAETAAEFAPTDRILRSDRAATRERDDTLNEWHLQLITDVQPYGVDASLVSLFFSAPDFPAAGLSQPAFRAMTLHPDLQLTTPGVRRAIVAHEFTHSLTAPVSAKFFREYAEEAKTVHAAVTAWKHGRFDGTLPNISSAEVKQLMYQHTREVGIYTYHDTTTEKAIAALQHFLTVANSAESSTIIDSYIEPVFGITPSSEEELRHARSLLLAVVMTKLEEDLKFAAQSRGEWSIDVEEGLCNYVGSMTTGTPFEEVNAFHKQDQAKVRATHGMQKQWGGDVGAVLQKLAREGLAPFVRDTRP